MMSRRVALRAVPLAATLIPAVFPPAHAQLAVIDPANLAQAVQQVQQMAQQLQAMQQQYQQLQQTYQAIAHAPSSPLTELGQQLNVEAFRNALPAQSNVLGSVMEGRALGPGAFGSAAQGQLERNRVYSPDGADFQAQEMQRTATSVAGAQAMASGLYQSATSRVAVLQAIEGQLATAADAKAVADLAARISAEQAYIQAQQVQAQSLVLWQQAQMRNRDQREQERRRQSIDALIAQAKARGG
ncbi:type IV secretion system protein [Azospirillum sp. TSA2s]|uniref:type IV secretion system protein n=1 Tax=Azospirillum sp. TSA2s TaxID=709810 RepID=UPI00145B40E2|nr:type IV secretion system protein [Azospirillum sp. TSA2s]